MKALLAIAGILATGFVTWWGIRAEWDKFGKIQRVLAVASVIVLVMTSLALYWYSTRTAHLTFSFYSDSIKDRDNLIESVSADVVSGKARVEFLVINNSDEIAGKGQLTIRIPIQSRFTDISPGWIAPPGSYEYERSYPIDSLHPDTLTPKMMMEFTVPHCARNFAILFTYKCTNCDNPEWKPIPISMRYPDVPCPCL